VAPLRQPVTSHSARRDALRASGSQRTTNTNSFRFKCCLYLWFFDSLKAGQGPARGGRELTAFGSSFLRTFDVTVGASQRDSEGC